MVETYRSAGRIDRTARRQRVIDHDEAAPRSDLPSDDPAQRPDQAEQPEPFEHPVCQPSRGVSARNACVTCPPDASRAPIISSVSVSRVPSGLDCTISPTHRQRVAGKPGSGGGSMASAGVCLGPHPLHGNLPPGDTLVRNPHRSSKSAGLNRVQFETRRFQFRSSPPWATLEGWYYGFQTGRGLETPVKSEISPLNPQHIAGYKSLLDRVIDPGL